jgi:hypothetical protein
MISRATTDHFHDFIEGKIYCSTAAFIGELPAKLTTNKSNHNIITKRPG